MIYLTFDDGPHPLWTAQILEVLARYRARATFFVTGGRAWQYPQLVARTAAAGHDVENHTYSHLRLDEVDRDTFLDQIRRTDRAIRLAAGEALAPPNCLRPPYGVLGDETYRHARTAGKAIVMWDIDSRDWWSPGTKAITKRVLEGARPGAVVLLHDAGGRGQTVEALDDMLSGLLSQGYKFALLCE